MQAAIEPPKQKTHLARKPLYAGLDALSEATALKIFKTQDYTISVNMVSSC